MNEYPEKIGRLGEWEKNVLLEVVQSSSGLSGSLENNRERGIGIYGGRSRVWG